MSDTAEQLGKIGMSEFRHVVRDHVRHSKESTRWKKVLSRKPELYDSLKGKGDIHWSLRDNFDDVIQDEWRTSFQCSICLMMDQRKCQETDKEEIVIRIARSGLRMIACVDTAEQALKLKTAFFDQSLHTFSASAEWRSTVLGLVKKFAGEMRINSSNRYYHPDPSTERRRKDTKHNQEYVVWNRNFFRPFPWGFNETATVPGGLTVFLFTCPPEAPSATRSTRMEPEEVKLDQ